MPLYQTTRLVFLAVLLPLYVRSTSLPHLLVHGIIIAAITSVLVVFCGMPLEELVALVVTAAVIVLWGINHIVNYIIVGEWHRLVLVYVISRGFLANMIEMEGLGWKRCKTMPSSMHKLYLRNKDFNLLVFGHPAIEAAFITYLLKDSVNTERAGLGFWLISLQLWVMIMGCIQEASLVGMNLLNENGEKKLGPWCYGIFHKVVLVCGSAKSINDAMEIVRAWAGALDTFMTERDADKIPIKNTHASKNELQAQSREHDLGTQYPSRLDSATLGEAENDELLRVVAQSKKAQKKSAAGRQIKPSTRRRG